MRILAPLACVVLLTASEARADIVVFKTGRTMSVQACRVDGDRATLVLRDGGEVAFAAALIERVDADEVEWPDPAGNREPGTGIRAEAGDAGSVDAAPGSRSPVPDSILSAKPYADLIAAAAAAHQVDPRLVHAVVEVESNYQARARSKKGAKGLMQLMPATARQYAVRDPYDPKANIEAGVKHLKDLLGRFDVALALAAYNAGEATIRRYGGLPPFPETQSYVRRILQKTGR
jgi:Transglycosylase SLT domain